MSEISIKGDETVMAWPAVYWVNRMTCRSELVHFLGVDVLETPAPVTLSLQPADVVPVRQGCANMIPGAMVMAKGDGIRAPAAGVLRFRVRYQTMSGAVTQSNHAVVLRAFP